MSYLTINRQIAHLRKINNITQAELAGHLGVSNQAVSKWESGQSCPDIQLIPKIAEYFNVSCDSLFGLGIKSQTPEDIVLSVRNTIINKTNEYSEQLVYDIIQGLCNVVGLKLTCDDDTFSNDSIVDVSSMNVINISNIGNNINLTKNDGCVIICNKSKIVPFEEIKKSYESIFNALSYKPCLIILRKLYDYYLKDSTKYTSYLDIIDDTGLEDDTVFHCLGDILGTFIEYDEDNEDDMCVRLDAKYIPVILGFSAILKTIND